MGIANCIGRVVFGDIVDILKQRFGDKIVVYVSITIVFILGLSKYKDICSTELVIRFRTPMLLNIEVYVS